ncbi:MAG: efflux RND transporter periplasmic adaptor subunit [Betaproteobacteria bacterium]|nr:efflux RND transporter periplasmic adaptor subunit [Betaproteobacteria bacterium]
MNSNMSLFPRGKRRLQGLALAVLALAGAVTWWFPDSKSADKGKWSGSVRPGNKDIASGSGKTTPISVGVVKQMDIRQSVDALGTMTALNTAVVRAKVDGELKALRFSEGQWVQAGQLLAEIDARPFEAQLNQAQGQLARDAAQLKNAQLDLQRYQDLLSKDAIARQQVETQAALVSQLQGTVQANQALVDAARLQLSYTRVTAPISGRLGLKQAELGSLVRASDPNGLVSITQIQPMAVVFAVPEVHVPLILRKLKAGQALPVQAWDREMRHRLAKGRVSTTDNAIDLATGTLRLKAILDNKDGQLFPNQFAQIRLELDTLKHVLAVPTQAIQRGAQGTLVYVLQDDSSVQTRVVQLLGVDGDWQAVRGELKVGEQVVTDGADRLRSGSKVEVVKAAMP